MHSSTFPTSPLAVIHTTLVSSVLASAMLLLALVFALINPVWSRAALALQGVTLGVMGLAWRWGPSRRIALYALLLAGSTMLWDPTLPPAVLPEEHVRQLLPLAVSVVVLADLLWQGASSFSPARIGVYAGLVELTEAAAFFRSNPSRLRAKLAAWDVALVTALDGSTLVTLEAVLAALQEHSSDPGGRGPAQSLRD